VKEENKTQISVRTD